LREILKVEAALWTFVYTPGVEATNNTAERALRSGVIWRRTTQGSQSTEGSAFVSRILTGSRLHSRLHSRRSWAVWNDFITTPTSFVFTSASTQS